MTLTLKLYIDESFRLCQTQAKREAGLQKGRCWIDFDQIRGNSAQLSFGKSHLELVYPTARGDCSLSAPYGDVLTVTEMRSGIFIRLKHGWFLFLPVTEKGKDNEKLMGAMILLTEKCRWTYQLARLRLPGVNLFSRLKFRLRPNTGTDLTDPFTRNYLILLILLCFFIGTIFTCMRFRTTDVPRQDAHAVTGIYMSADPSRSRHNYRFVDLEFSDGNEYTIDGCCINQDLLHTLDDIPSGTQMKLLLHPVTDAVLEIQVQQQILLHFEDTLLRLQREATVFFFLGIGMYLCGGYLLWGTIRKKL